MRGSARPARLPVGRERAATPAPPWRLVGDDGDGTRRERRPPTPAERRAGSRGGGALGLLAFLGGGGERPRRPRRGDWWATMGTARGESGDRRRQQNGGPGHEVRPPGLRVTTWSRWR